MLSATYQANTVMRFMPRIFDQKYIHLYNLMFSFAIFLNCANAGFCSRVAFPSCVKTTQHNLKGATQLLQCFKNRINCTQTRLRLL